MVVSSRQRIEPGQHQEQLGAILDQVVGEDLTVEVTFEAEI